MLRAWIDIQLSSQVGGGCACAVMVVPHTIFVHFSRFESANLNEISIQRRTTWVEAKNLLFLFVSTENEFPARSREIGKAERKREQRVLRCKRASILCNVQGEVKVLAEPQSLLSIANLADP